MQDISSKNRRYVLTPSLTDLTTFRTMSRLLLLLISLLIASAIHNAYAQGLRFHGNETDIADRSGLTIPSPEDTPFPVNHLSVKFSIHVNNPSSSGFIFGITNKETGEMLNLMLRNTFSGDSVYISFAKEGERELCTSSFHTHDITARNIGIAAEIDKESDSGKISIDGKTHHVDKLGLAGKDFTPQLNFGLTRHIVETASVSISDLCIATDGSRREIPLKESDGTAVHDSKGKVAGLAYNPIWQINEAFHWRKIAEFKSPTPTGCAFDPVNRKFYSYNSDSITTFDANRLHIKKTPLKGDGKLPVRHGMNLYSTKTGMIYPYEIYYDDFSCEINPEEATWRLLAHTNDNKAIHHHAHILCNNDSATWIFGGYGDRKYFNKFVRFNLHTHRFDTIPLKGDGIPPRFFASMGATASGDTIYLYGGKGNKEGKQDLGVKYYYDLYLINLKDSTSKRLWRQTPPSKDMVPVRTLLPSTKEGCVYAMAYPEYRTHSSLQLYRISLSDGSRTAVGDSIPILSDEIATNAALYRPTGGDMIFCVVQEFEKEGATTTRIYSLAAPPVSEDEIIAMSGNGLREKTPIWIYITGISIICLITLAIIIIRRHRHCPKSLTANPTDALAGPANPDPHESQIVQPIQESSLPQEHEQPYVIKNETSSDTTFNPDTSTHPIADEFLPNLTDKNHISLFGPFLVTGESGRDITYMFSPKLKKMFIYILLYTVSRNGVTSSDLSSVFWADKEPDKVKNLRNVTLNKLRKVLSEMVGISLVYEQGLFRIDMTAEVGCDFLEIYRLSSSLHNFNPDNDKCRIINSILIKGKFLADTEDPIFDYFRQKIESYTIEYLAATIEYNFNHGKYDKARRLCNTLMKTDPISEVALEYGIKSCRAIGMNDKAMTIYSSFVKEYRRMMGEDYPHPIDKFS